MRKGIVDHGPVYVIMGDAHPSQGLGTDYRAIGDAQEGIVLMRLWSWPFVARKTHTGFLGRLTAPPRGGHHYGSPGIGNQAAIRHVEGPGDPSGVVVVVECHGGCRASPLYTCLGTSLHDCVCLAMVDQRYPRASPMFDALPTCCHGEIHVKIKIK